MAKINGIPSTETIWTKRLNGKGDVYYITTKGFDMNTFFIYKMVNEKATKLGKGKSPLLLEEKFVED